MIISKEIDFNEPLTPEELKMLKDLETRPIQFDEDCPELTDEQLKSMYRVKDQNRQERNKQTVTIRLSPQALRKAKSLGKGYTSVLSRILEKALNDNEMIKTCL